MLCDRAAFFLTYSVCKKCMQSKNLLRVYSRTMLSHISSFTQRARQMLSQATKLSEIIAQTWRPAAYQWNPIVWLVTVHLEMSQPSSGPKYFDINLMLDLSLSQRFLTRIELPIFWLCNFSIAIFSGVLTFDETWKLINFTWNENLNFKPERL